MVITDAYTRLHTHTHLSEAICDVLKLCSLCTERSGLTPRRKKTNEKSFNLILSEKKMKWSQNSLHVYIYVSESLVDNDIVFNS